MPPDSPATKPFADGSPGTHLAAADHKLAAARWVLGDPVSRDPETGEVWQYLGTSFDPGRRRWRHAFRHRHHPATGRQEHVDVSAPAGWGPPRSGGEP
ncbi:hypothetical protein [Gloeobacter morelensis]|uniref:hypothetical protein n=1 Tax=Gloeobacter morelensis TaxID=2907343 RepID=UPI001E506C99|nr:hypothetical protein [Gloeobacter morelensis]UFP97199.1 hypothetical protein ISF26_24060 [Gloeobacter morelensis MG652769]